MLDFICSRNGGVQYDDLFYPVPTTNYDAGEAASNSAQALARFMQIANYYVFDRLVDFITTAPQPDVDHLVIWVRVAILIILCQNQTAKCSAVKVRCYNCQSKSTNNFSRMYRWYTIKRYNRSFLKARTFMWQMRLLRTIK